MVRKNAIIDDNGSPTESALRALTVIKLSVLAAVSLPRCHGTSQNNFRKVGWVCCAKIHTCCVFQVSALWGCCFGGNLSSAVSKWQRNKSCPQVRVKH